MCNSIVLLGPTATGKTSVGVALARALGGEILSADSRQVYRGLDIGSGKDLQEYGMVPHHLIDIADLSQEFTLFAWQQAFYTAFAGIAARGALPLLVGGTGMYIDSVVRGYDLMPVPPDEALRARLDAMPLADLVAMLRQLRPNHHNTSDFTDKARTIKAIMIARFMQSPQCAELKRALAPRPDFRPLVLGMTLPRARLRESIRLRLRERLDAGMIDEVRALHQNGASWERLERLGLEYRFVAQFLQGKIGGSEEMFVRLSTAIGQFAKRQETWFRGMERKGVRIHWLPQAASKEERVAAALGLWSKSAQTLPNSVFP